MKLRKASCWEKTRNFVNGLGRKSIDRRAFLDTIEDFGVTRETAEEYKSILFHSGRIRHTTKGQVQKAGKKIPASFTYSKARNMTTRSRIDRYCDMF